MRIRFKIFAAVAMILIPVLLSGCSSGISLGSSDAAIGLIIDNSADQTPVNTPHVSSEPPETKGRETPLAIALICQSHQDIYPYW